MRKQSSLGKVVLKTTDQTMSGKERDERERVNISNFVDFALSMNMEIDFIPRPETSTTDRGDVLVTTGCELYDEDNDTVMVFEEGDVIDVKGHWLNPVQHNTKHYPEWVIFMDRWEHGQIGIVTGEECLTQGEKGCLRFNTRRGKFYLLDKYYWDVLEEVNG